MPKCKETPGIIKAACNYLMKNARITIILMLAFVMRMAYLERPFLGIDEGHTTSVLVQSWSGLITNVYYEYSPPLYYLLAKTVLLLSQDMFFVRLISVISGVLLVLFSYLLIKRIANENTGLICALLVTTNPLLIGYSQHLRNYMFLLFLFIASLYFLKLYLEEKKNKHLLTTIFVNVLLVFTHYHAVIMIFSVTVFLLLYRFRLKKELVLKKAFLLAAVPAVFFLVNVPMVIASIQRASTDSWINSVGIIDLGYLFYKYFVAANISLVNSNNMLLFAVLPLSLALFLFGTWKMWNEKKILYLFMAIFPIILCFALAQLVPFFFHYRYLVYTLPMMLGVIAFGINQIKNTYLKTVILSLLLLTWIWITFIYYGITSTQDWGLLFGL